MVSSRISSSINEVLELRGLTQTWLAAEIEMKQPQLHRYLTGKQPLPLPVLDDCLDALDLTLEELLAITPASLKEDQLEAIGIILKLDEEKLGIALDTLRALPGLRLGVDDLDSAGGQLKRKT